MTSGFFVLRTPLLPVETLTALSGPIDDDEHLEAALSDARAHAPGGIPYRGASIRWSSGSVLASARRARPITSR